MEGSWYNYFGLQNQEKTCRAASRGADAWRAHEWNKNHDCFDVDEKVHMMRFRVPLSVHKSTFAQIIEQLEQTSNTVSAQHNQGCAYLQVGCSRQVRVHGILEKIFYQDIGF